MLHQLAAAHHHLQAPEPREVVERVSGTHDEVGQVPQIADETVDALRLVAVVVGNQYEWSFVFCHDKKAFGLQKYEKKPESQASEQEKLHFGRGFRLQDFGNRVVHGLFLSVS